MNLFSIIGFLLASIVFVVGLYLASPNLSLFWDVPSVFIVIGGTIASTAISFQLDRIVVLFKVFIDRMIFGKKFDYKKIIQEIMKFSEEARKGTSLGDLAKKASDPFLAEALSLIDDGILSEDQLVDILSKRKKQMYILYMKDAQRIQSIGKFPPAFGMLGTTIGMIVLLANLNGADAIKMIGPAMGVCLITTLYGCALANFVVIPAAENLIEQTEEFNVKNEIVIQGCLLIMDKTNPIIVAEELNSFLQPHLRLDWKNVAGA